LYARYPQTETAHFWRINIELINQQILKPVRAMLVADITLLFMAKSTVPVRIEIQSCGSSVTSGDS